MRESWNNPTLAPHLARNPPSCGKAAAIFTRGAYAEYVSAHEAKRHVCAPEGAKMVRTPLAAFLTTPLRGFANLDALWVPSDMMAEVQPG